MVNSFCSRCFSFCSSIRFSIDAVIELNELARVASWSCDFTEMRWLKSPRLMWVGGVVELGDGAGHGAGQAGPDEQRQQFDDGENHRREQQQILHAGGKVTQRGEQAGIEHRRPSLDPEQRARFLLLAGRPIHDGKRRSES